MLTVTLILSEHDLEMYTASSSMCSGVGAVRWRPTGVVWPLKKNKKKITAMMSFENGQ